MGKVSLQKTVSWVEDKLFLILHQISLITNATAQQRVLIDIMLQKKQKNIDYYGNFGYVFP